MKNIKKQWFTLVELIVVITILAILWSIAFISLQGYSADARNSKRNSDLGSIQSAMSSQLAQWQSILSFVSDHKNTTAWHVTIWSWLQVAWTWFAPTTYTEYDAWTVNYASLPVKSDDFKDPSANLPYVVWVTTRNNGKYELAATIEQWAGSKVAKIIGDYNPRKVKIPIYTKTWAVTTDLILTGATNINYFFPWDFVTQSGASVAYKISKISKDWTTLTFETWALYNFAALNIAQVETPWLINNSTAWATGNTVTEWQSSYLPYTW